MSYLKYTEEICKASVAQKQLLCFIICFYYIILLKDNYEHFSIKYYKTLEIKL